MIKMARNFVSLKATAVGLAAAAICLLVMAPASAEIFTIELNNGKTIDSRYQPQRADWDDNTILLLTDVGNWIALPESIIADVRALTEVQGFGKVISTTAIELGFSPNDAPDPSAPKQPGDPITEALRVLAGGNRGGASLDDYAVQQFVEPGQATGIPGNLIGTGMSAPNTNPIEPN